MRKRQRINKDLGSDSISIGCSCEKIEIAAECSLRLMDDMEVEAVVKAPSDDGEAMDIEEGADENDQAALVGLIECILPQDVLVTMVDPHGDTPDRAIQAQWAVVPLMRRIFRAKNETKLHVLFTEKFAEVQETHRELWPGFGPPKMLQSKHQRATANSDSEAEPQIVYLKQKSVPTSMAMAWLAWGASKSRRMAEDRSRTLSYLKELLDHVLQRAGKLDFRVVKIGRPQDGETSVQVSAMNPYLNSRLLWTKSQDCRIVPTWELCRIDSKHAVSSGADRPHWLDIVAFAVDSKGGLAQRLLKPLAFTLLAQAASWMDDNMSRLALEASEFQRTGRKNRFQSKAANFLAMVQAANFLLQENETLAYIGVTCLFPD